ncbi:autotransporter outer membrane beta-barrel domain-containing protein [Tardiphaga sp. 768_D3_N2_1]|uniref:autotransporter outer membrane beta-barrel domain-containing protein n=1 Tax=Tardiphaga sp. 768_D3_N2_1 TaxID=3240783 RepID=UPI003F88DBFF
MVMTVKKLRAALLAASVLTLASALPAMAQTTWVAHPGSNNFFDAGNWSSGVPGGSDTAYFGVSDTTTITHDNVVGGGGGYTYAGAWVFNAGASNYTITNTNGFLNFFGGAGIVINGGSLTLVNNGVLVMSSSSSLGTATVNNNGSLEFYGSSTAGNSIINGGASFYQGSTAGNAIITSAGIDGIYFWDNSTAGNAQLINKGWLGVDISGSTGPNGDHKLSAGSIEGSSAFKLGANELTVGSNNLSTTVSGAITDGGNGGGTGGSLVKIGTGTLTLTGTNTYTGSTTISAGTLQIGDGGAGGSVAGNIVNNSALIFNRSDNSTYGGVISGSGTVEKLGAGTLTLTSASTYTGATTITAGTLEILGSIASSVITNYGQLTFLGNTTAGSAVITNSGTVLFDGNSTAGNAQLINNAPGAVVNFFTPGPASDGRISAASIAGSGRFDLNSVELTVGSNNLSTTVTGVLTGTGTATGQSLVKTGTGKLMLSGINTYTGATVVDAGTLSVNGSIAASSLTTVNAGATLGGTGTVGNTTINGGTLAPGNSIGTLTVQGNLVLTSASSYMVEVSPAASDRTNVTGTATLGGATVQASFASGSYVAKKYTIISADGGLGGSTFSSFVTTNLPDGFRSSLSYDGNNAYLDLEMIFARPATAGAGGNQQGVGNALVNYFNGNGGIPMVYGGLTANGLTQVSGETTTGSQQTSFNAMTQFMGMMMDPSAAGRSDAPPVASGFAASDAMAYAPEARSKAPRDAYAAITKAMPHASVFEQRWSMWASGFGGSQSTDGNAAAGSNSATSRIYGAAAGADVWLSPTTLAGISMAGGATSFSVAQGGTGQSDLVQVGGFLRHTIGGAYLSAAFAYGWQDITTERLVTVAGADRLRARFNANSYAGRVELGSRSAVAELNGIGLTPYAAGQITILDLPAYAESVVSGSNAFALGYTAKTVMAPRTELGLRADKAFALDGALLTLRGRAAWAHDFNTDRAASATFQALPGASFVVNGAAAARDAALTTASAELTWGNGFSLAATFEGEFSETTRSYAGKGVARYAW